MSKLIDVLIRSGNLSGSVRVGPHSLAQLKSSLKEVPFALVTPSMSGVLDATKLAQAISALSKTPGLDLAALGPLQPLLKQIASGRVPDVAAVVGAMGAGAALGAALTTLGGALDAIAKTAGPGSVGQTDAPAPSTTSGGS